MTSKDASLVEFGYFKGLDVKSVLDLNFDNTTYFSSEKSDYLLAKNLGTFVIHSDHFVFISNKSEEDFFVDIYSNSSDVNEGIMYQHLASLFQKHYQARHIPSTFKGVPVESILSLNEDNTTYAPANERDGSVSYFIGNDGRSINVFVHPEHFVVKSFKSSFPHETILIEKSSTNIDELMLFHHLKNIDDCYNGIVHGRDVKDIFLLNKSNTKYNVPTDSAYLVPFLSFSLGKIFVHKDRFIIDLLDDDCDDDYYIKKSTIEKNSKIPGEIKLYNFLKNLVSELEVKDNSGVKADIQKAIDNCRAQIVTLEAILEIL